MLIVPAAIAALLLVVPMVTLVADTPWSDFGDQVTSRAVGEALWLTVLASAFTVVLCLLLGTPLAWVLARVAFPGRSVLRAAVLVPLVLPPVVAGVALVTALGRTGFVGKPLVRGLRHHHPLHDDGRGDRAHLRLVAVLRARGRGRTPLRG